MSLAAGRLRHRIRVEQLVQTQDSNGDPIDTWTLWATLWAEVSPLSGKALVAAQAVQSKIVARILVRWRPGLVAKMRITHGGRYYNIEAVLPDPDSGVEYATLPVSEGTNEG